LTTRHTRGVAVIAMPSTWALACAACLAACVTPKAPREEHDDHGKLRAQGLVTRNADGQEVRTGHWVFWYPSGQKRGEGDFDNGKLDGKVDELGLPVDGQRGVWRGFYADGRAAFAYMLDDDGRHVGRSTRWYDDGQLASEATPLDRQSRFVVRQWRRDGRKWLESTQDQDGRFDGLVTEWDEDGEVLRQEAYSLGKRVGARGPQLR
jgi:antitoxin component YwqK of YwqJK toxin-antitoxin module